MPNRTPQEVASQFASYADSVAAFSLAQGILYAIALGANDFRFMVRQCPIALYAGIAAFNILYLFVVFVCHHVENNLVGEPGGPDPAGLWARRGRRGRWIVVVLAMALCLSTTWAVSRDVSICHCLTLPPAHAETPVPSGPAFGGKS
jgi:hypothetical protein